MSEELPGGTLSLRRRVVPTRRFGDRVIVARPADGAPVVLATTAAVVWDRMDGWTTPAQLDDELARAFPDVEPDERSRARYDIIVTLGADDLVERR